MFRHGRVGRVVNRFPLRLVGRQPRIVLGAQTGFRFFDPAALAVLDFPARVFVRLAAGFLGG